MIVDYAIYEHGERLPDEVPLPEAAKRCRGSERFVWLGLYEPTEDEFEAVGRELAGLTPYHAIKRSLHLLVPGSTAVVIGAGGLGHMAVQILSALAPATIVAVDRSEAALRLATAVGAQHGVVFGSDAATEIRDLTDGVGADLVLDLVGSDDTLQLGASVARTLGHLTLVGLAGGSLAMSFFGLPYELSVASTYWGSVPELIEVIALARSGKIAAHIERFSLDDAADAYEQMRAGTLHGRAVIVPKQ